MRDKQFLCMHITLMNLAMKSLSSQQTGSLGRFTILVEFFLDNFFHPFILKELLQSGVIDEWLNIVVTYLA